MLLSEATRAWMMANGFDPQHPDVPAKYNDTALILASRCGEEDIVDELLSAGVEVNHRNMDGTNALWAAVVVDSYDIADSLLAAGVDIDNQNDNGATALMYAASNGKQGWVRYLLEKGAETRLRSLDDFTAQELASTVEILHLLRKAG